MASRLEYENACQSRIPKRFVRIILVALLRLKSSYKTTSHVTVRDIIKTLKTGFLLRNKSHIHCQHLLCIFDNNQIILRFYNNSIYLLVDCINSFYIRTRCGFRLPQRSHLRTLKNFVSEKSGKRCENSGKHWIKSGNREISRRFIFFLYLRLKMCGNVLNI